MPRYTGTRYSAMLGGGAEFLPSQLENLEAWYRYNQGITVTGSGVSQWDDQSGNGNHLVQATDTNRPAHHADGSVACDGVDNFMAVNYAPHAQPRTRYFLFKRTTFVNGGGIADSYTINNALVRMLNAVDNIELYAGAAGCGSTDLARGDYGVLSVIFNGASSSLQINNGTPSTCNAGALTQGGLTIGAVGGGAASHTDSQFKEICDFSAAHDADTRGQMVNYLMGVGGL